jgi:anti-sigma factor RsiW
MNTTAEELHSLLGAYALGALSEKDHHAFTDHLRSCAQCRTELDELARLPRLLDLLDPAVVETLARS